jgi:hypothetical protein
MPAFKVLYNRVGVAWVISKGISRLRGSGIADGRRTCFTDEPRWQHINEPGGRMTLDPAALNCPIPMGEPFWVYGPRNGDAPPLPHHWYLRSASLPLAPGTVHFSATLAAIQSTGFAPVPPAAAI